MKEKTVLKITVGQMHDILTKEKNLDRDAIENIVKEMQEANRQNFMDWEHEKMVKTGKKYDSQ